MKAHQLNINTIFFRKNNLFGIFYILLILQIKSMSSLIFGFGLRNVSNDINYVSELNYITFVICYEIIKDVIM